MNKNKINDINRNRNINYHFKREYYTKTLQINQYGILKKCSCTLQEVKKRQTNKKQIK